MIVDCIACNPKYFIVYGFCPQCKRMCHPPLIDTKNISVLDANQMIEDWILERDTGIKIDRTIYL